MKSRVEIKAKARETLHTRYGPVLLVSFVFTALLAALTGASYGAAALILMGPLTVGLCWGTLGFWRDRKPGLGECFIRGFDNIGRKIGGYLWMMLFVMLWSMLFVIPGIVKSYSYAMTPYILADLPDVPAKDALKLSMRTMDGHKAELFVLDLSFLGWALLSALTGGILMVLYVQPYILLAKAGYYDELKQEALRSGLLVAAA